MKKMEVAAVVGRIEILKTKHQTLEQSMRDMLSSGIHFITSQWTLFHSQKVKIDLEAMRKIEAGVKKERILLREKRQELIAIIRRRKALEELRSKKSVEYRRQENRKEQKRIDEAYLLSEPARKEAA